MIERRLPTYIRVNDDANRASTDYFHYDVIRSKKGIISFMPRIFGVIISGAFAADKHDGHRVAGADADDYHRGIFDDDGLSALFSGNDGRACSIEILITTHIIGRRKSEFRRLICH